MDACNPHYMLQHYIGQMTYMEKAKFEAYFRDENYTKHLDSLGQGLARSMMSLPTDYETEEEVRLIFSALRQQPWNLDKVQFTGSFASIPFKWANVIDQVVVDPSRASTAKAQVIASLAAVGITCPVV